MTDSSTPAPAGADAAAPGEPLLVEVWSDVVCPWCYVGIANLDAAISQLDRPSDVDVRFRSFQLDPSAKTHSAADHLEGLARKYGTTVEEMRARQDQLVAVGAAAGIEFRFDQAISGNTFDAHRLLHLADRHGVQHEVKHGLLKAYFTDGRAIAEPETLREVGTGAGMPAEEVDALLAGDAYADEVRTDIAVARSNGIGGVPFFLVDERLALSGAQPSELIVKVLRKALDERRPAITMVGDPAASACGPDGCEI